MVLDQGDGRQRFAARGTSDTLGQIDREATASRDARPGAAVSLQQRSKKIMFVVMHVHRRSGPLRLLRAQVA